MIDKKHIGMKLPRLNATAEAGQLRFFAKSTGETNPIYFDESAARDAGHPGLPLPPTFLFSLEFQQPVERLARRDRHRHVAHPARRAVVHLPPHGLRRRRAALRDAASPTSTTRRAAP